MTASTRVTRLRELVLDCGKREASRQNWTERHRRRARLAMWWNSYQGIAFLSGQLFTARGKTRCGT